MRRINVPLMLTSLGLFAATSLAVGCSSSHRSYSRTATASTSSGQAARSTSPSQSSASFQPVSDKPADTDDNTTAFTREKSTYFYYPSSEVYFAPDRNLYFWQAAPNRWQSGEQLPRTVRVREAEREMIHLRSLEPQRYHSKIKLAYPAGGMLTTIE